VTKAEALIVLVPSRGQVRHRDDARRSAKSLWTFEGWGSGVIAKRRGGGQGDQGPLIASAASRDQVGVARPEGSEHAPPTIVIEGVKELVEALQAA